MAGLFSAFVPQDRARHSQVELLTGAVPIAHAGALGLEAASSRAGVQDQLGDARDDVVHLPTQHLSGRPTRDLLRLGIEVGDGAVRVGGEQAAHEALDGALVEIAQADQVVGAAVECLARPVQLPREHACECTDQEERANVNPPDGPERHPGQRVDLLGDARRAPGVCSKQHTHVARRTQAGGAEGPPALE